MNSQFGRFPKTRYLGSKRKLLPVLNELFSTLEFETALDPFSGTAAVAYLLKSLGAEVTAGDTMAFNALTARALVVNQTVRLGDGVETFLSAVERVDVSRGFIERTFDGVFYPRGENRFLDRALIALGQHHGIERDMLLYCLGQAALAKRPYNLFHRANLNMRERDVNRSFGNKKTWDTPFDVLIRRFAAQLDQAVFDSKKNCVAVVSDVMSVEPAQYDLVYLDPPYVSQRGQGVDYVDYYHFLEGLSEPDGWSNRILHRYKHKPIVGRRESPWSDAERIESAFEAVITRFKDSILVISYRSDGIPDISKITAWLEHVGKKVTIVDIGKYTYALSTNRKSKEIILLGQ